MITNTSALIGYFVSGEMSNKYGSKKRPIVFFNVIIIIMALFYILDFDDNVVFIIIFIINIVSCIQINIMKIMLNSYFFTDIKGTVFGFATFVSCFGFFMVPAIAE